MKSDMKSLKSYFNNTLSRFIIESDDVGFSYIHRSVSMNSRRVRYFFVNAFRYPERIVEEREITATDARLMIDEVLRAEDRAQEATE